MSELRVGLAGVSGMRVGTSPVNAVYLGDDLIWPTPVLGPVHVITVDASDAASGTNEPFLPRTGWEADDFGGGNSTTIWRTYNDGSYKVIFPVDAGTLHYDSGEDSHEAEVYFKLQQPDGVVGCAIALDSADSTAYVGWEAVRHDGGVGGIAYAENKLVFYFRDGAAHDEFYVQLGAGLVGDQWYRMRCRIVGDVVSAWLDDVLVNEHTLTAAQVTRLAGHTRAGAINFAGNSNYQQITINKIVPTAPIPPSITTINPDIGPDDGGTLVRLAGAAFVVGSTTVKVGGATVSATATSATALTFTTPAHAAGAVDVEVVTPVGTSGAQTFTYSTAAAPTLSGASPSSGDPGETITLTGTDFATGQTWVEVGGILVDNADVTVGGPTSLTFAVPAAAAYGATTAKVYAPGGTSGTTAFTVTAPPPPTTNMIMWLDPSAESYSNDDPVGTMNDQAPGGGADATAAGAVRPLYKTAGINGQPSLLFDGVDDYLTLPSITSVFTAGFTLFVVMLPVTGSTFPQKLLVMSSQVAGLLDDIALGFRQSTNLVQFQTQGSAGTYGYYQSSPIYSSATYTDPVVLTATIVGGGAGTSGSSTLRKDGVPAGSANVFIPPSNTRITNWIGRSFYSGDAYFSGHLGDMILYNTLLTPTQIASVNAYLMDKYGI